MGQIVFFDSSNDVKFVRWPAENEMRRYCRMHNIPCLLVVEGGVEPPVCDDPCEDWVRTPISHSDLEARVAALRHRAYGRQAPTVDAAGTVHFGRKTVGLSTIQAELMELLVESYRDVVYRSELTQRLAESSQGDATRNSLDLHIMRLRKRLTPVQLVIRTVWGRGYRLEPQIRIPIPADRLNSRVS
ncbi:winged helix-turn-helix domain-containing protein [Nocardia sp. CDC159]|uniref:Winged helix-turn-helix domain-containing protein n=1 Tax=Nocardia pulmonis TaxID=2951408 RepID=A0A9X2E2Q5_9NOCA|nr:MULTISPECIES: winged helix-turn-helix domain-containing protein [Nocardia]MCM6773174.1 winged helix-turn-helix domain-containing protein [Nocardia pulmonis]MCM6785523.1 winged helix-turn-helix domain-containing protein [Nocardia sp. CDC159]